MAAAKPKAKPNGRRNRFYIFLSEDGHALLADMCAPRGGIDRAKSTVIEEAIRRMHAVDPLVPKRKRQKIDEVE